MTKEQRSVNHGQQDIYIYIASQTDSPPTIQSDSQSDSQQPIGGSVIQTVKGEDLALGCGAPKNHITCGSWNFRSKYSNDLP